MDEWEYYVTVLEARVSKEKSQIAPYVKWQPAQLPKLSPLSLIPILNELGAAGWELITCHPYTFGENHDIVSYSVTGAKTWQGVQYTNQYLCVFKRRKIALPQ